MADVWTRRKKALAPNLRVPLEAFWIRRRGVEESEQEIPDRKIYPLMFPNYYYLVGQQEGQKKKKQVKCFAAASLSDGLTLVA